MSPLSSKGSLLRSARGMQPTHGVVRHGVSANAWFHGMHGKSLGNSRRAGRCTAGFIAMLGIALKTRTK